MEKIKVPKIFPEFDNNLKMTLAIITSLSTFILLYLSLLSLAGPAGNSIGSFLRNLLGRAAFVFPLIFLIVGIVLIRIQQNPDFKRDVSGFKVIWGFVLMIVAFAGLLSLVFGTNTMVDIQLGGGWIGYLLYPQIFGVFGPIAGFILILSTALFGFFLTSQLTVAGFLETCNKVYKDPKKFWDLVPDIYELWKTEPEHVSEKEQPEDNLDEMISSVIYDGSISDTPAKSSGNNDDGIENEESNKIKEFIDVVISKPTKPSPAKKKFTAVAEGEGTMDMAPISEDDGSWKAPSTNLLKVSRAKKGVDSEVKKRIEQNKEIVRNTLENFGIKVTMSDTYVGPTVTQYTLKPDTGVRLSTIDSLQRDLALALASPSIRIEAPISGKSLVGIEIPNEKKSPVRLGDIIYHPKFQQFKGDLPIVVGKDVAGKEIVYSLAKAPHLLVAGATGAGKSVWINGMLLSLLSTYSPFELQLIMVDMKRVELKLYEGIPHLMCSVITEADKAINSLKWTVLEMDRRYSLLEKHGKRNINDYNDFAKSFKKDDEDKPERMPYMVFVIDELGDLMMIAKSEVEPIIVRLTQMSRAVGIHLVLGTQRPDTNVVTGLIKANVPTRIAFTVASQIDSRVILDTGGAEKLLGMGDGLISTPSLMKPIRFQGPFVEESEVVEHVKSLQKQANQMNFNNHNETITQPPKTKVNVPGMSAGKSSREAAGDEAYEEAKKIVVQYQKASTSFLQQTMGVGYPKAAKIINRLEQNGVVGPQNGSKPRDVYILPEELDEE